MCARSRTVIEWNAGLCTHWFDRLMHMHTAQIYIFIIVQKRLHSSLHLFLHAACMAWKYSSRPFQLRSRVYWDFEVSAILWNFLYVSMGLSLKKSIVHHIYFIICCRCRLEWFDHNQELELGWKRHKIQKWHVMFERGGKMHIAIGQSLIDKAFDRVSGKSNQCITQTQPPTPTHD